MDNLIEIIVSIATGILTAIPLIVKLVKVVKNSIKEKNWNIVLGLVIDLMKQAENMFADGFTRKEWVIESVKSMALSINYVLDDEAISKISDMIDKICGATKVINTDYSLIDDGK